MEKTHTLRSLLYGWESAKKRLEAASADKSKLATRYGVMYWKREVQAAERAEEHWRTKISKFGSGKLIKVTGQVRVVMGGLGLNQEFELFMVNVSKEDVLEYLKAQADNSLQQILLETIELKEFQTGRLIIV